MHQIDYGFVIRECKKVLGLPDISREMRLAIIMGKLLAYQTIDEYHKQAKKKKKQPNLYHAKQKLMRRAIDVISQIDFENRQLQKMLPK